MDKIIIFLAFLFLTVPAAAQEQNGYTYTPEGCDFTIDFPEEPGEGRRCPSDTTMPCQKIARFTQIFNDKTTVYAEMSCEPIAQNVRETYTQDVIEELVRKLAVDADPEGLGLTYQEFDEGKIKIAAMSGLRNKGLAQAIYIAQVSIGPNSVMTFEGTLAGPENTDADQTFAQILSSLKPVVTLNQSFEDAETE